jgi:hypothetical protein
VNAYEIEQIEKQMRSELRLPLQYQAWADIERSARQERARVVGKAMAGFFTAVLAKISGAARQIRSTAAECTDARLRHDH